MAMIDEIGDFLQANGHGVKGVSLFGGTMPPRPDNIVGIYEQVGFEPERAMGRRVLDVLNLQTIVRDLDSATAESRAFAIYANLDFFVGVISGVRYAAILARQAPFSLGVDENKRTKWSCNYIAHREAV